ncbi:MAG: anaerobic ribonucleoside-triphosphate reductase, partial [Lachnospiraceae bacterium]|nr:anaerobic ribonucleoside-triphosphate reductase [Lachnospiraceae bacterium]
MRVIKRDGREVEYDRNKIAIAIEKANDGVDIRERIAEDKIYNIIAAIENRGVNTMHVEDIQDIIEEKLMSEKKFALAKAYIKYRYTRELVRKANTTDDSIMSLIKNSNKDVMEENSNKNAIIASTQRDLIAGEVSKDLT